MGQPESTMTEELSTLVLEQLGRTTRTSP